METKTETPKVVRLPKTEDHTLIKTSAALRGMTMGEYVMALVRKDNP